MKRRNVFRVAVFYVVTSWLTLQVLDVIGQILSLPDWMAKGVLALLAIGLIPALIFSWVYEMTPEGLKREVDVVRDESITPVTARKLDMAVILLLIPTLGLLIYQQFRTEPQPSATPVAQAPSSSEAPVAKVASVEAENERSIAVLPFANRSAREEDLFFTDGIHDDLLTQLAKVASLKVISRTSVMRYRDTEMPIPEIAGQLGVATILEGGIQRAGDQIRINVQLIEAKSDKHLWAETFDRLMTTDNLFAIQSEITREIISALKATLTPEEASRIDHRPTKNLEAFQEYMKGKQLLPLRTVEAITQGKAHFERALELEAEFPEAMVWLANAYHLMNEYAGWAVADSIDVADGLVDRALMLSPQLGDAYMLRGELRRHQGRFDESEAAFKLANELAPSNATTLHWFALLNDMQGHQDKSVELLRRAHELDPMSRIIHLNYAARQFYQGKDEESLAEFDRIKMLHPSYPAIYGYESWIRFVHGDAVGRLRAGLKARELDPLSSRTGLCAAYADLNVTARALECFQRDERPAVAGYYLEMVYVQMLLGDREAAESALAEASAVAGPGDQGWLAGTAAMIGDFDLARNVLMESDPEWFGSEPVSVTLRQMNKATTAAQVMIQSGEVERAQQLLNAVLEHISGLDRNRGVNGFGFLDVQANALLGDREAALTALEDAVEKQYLSYWQFLRFSSVFDDLRDDLRFSAAVDRLRIAAEVHREQAREEGLL